VLPYTQWEAGIGRAYPSQVLLRYADMDTKDFATKTKSVPLAPGRSLPYLAAFLPFFSPERTVRLNSENIRCLQRARYPVILATFDPQVRWSRAWEGDYATGHE
jgi:hypothetical protein